MVLPESLESPGYGLLPPELQPKRKIAAKASNAKSKRCLFISPPDKKPLSSNIENFRNYIPPHRNSILNGSQRFKGSG
jgi:hypothetical protein